jgi:hypothetical protein
MSTSNRKMKELWSKLSKEGFFQASQQGVQEGLEF